MAQNLADKYSAKVAERFAHKAYSAGIAGNAYDFDGVKTIKVYSIDTVPLGDYSKLSSGTPITGFNGSRYGTPVDLTDSFQVMTLTQDKAFTYIIDKGDDKQQLNIKKANKALAREIDERINPWLDKYNFKRWIAGAGQVVTGTAGYANGNAKPLEMIQDANELLDEQACPDSGRTLVCSANFYKLLKRDPNFVYTEKLAGEAMIRGKMGEMDGMTIRRVPNNYLPSGVYGFVTHSAALLNPMKLKEYKIHTDPPGINGNLTEGRLIHDAFVLDAKADAIVVLCTAATQTVKPMVTITSHSASVTPGSGVTAYYTLDGSDPRCSGTRAQYSSAVTTVSGQTIRVAGYKAGQVIEWGKAEATDP